jgi:hypothetical protein
MPHNQIVFFIKSYSIQPSITKPFSSINYVDYHYAFIVSARYTTLIARKHPHVRVESKHHSPSSITKLGKNV